MSAPSSFTTCDLCDAHEGDTSGAFRVLAPVFHDYGAVRALALMPLRTEKRGEGQAGEPVQIQGVWVRPGDWLYADEDGMVVADRALV